MLCNENEKKKKEKEIETEQYQLVPRLGCPYAMLEINFYLYKRSSTVPLKYRATHMHPKHEKKCL